MKDVFKCSLHGMAEIVGQGWSKQIGSAVLGAALFCVPMIPMAAMADSSAVSHVEYIQWLVQATGDRAQFSASSTAADYIQWAKNKGLNPTGGWQANAKLSSDALAQTVVQLLNINPNKQGGNSKRILLREGINIPDEVTRQGLVSLIDDPNLVIRFGPVGSPTKPGNGIGFGIGWYNHNGVPPPALPPGPPPGAGNHGNGNR